MSNLLDGVQIVELAQLISGPYCGLLFAGLGADVLKVEEPEVGDISRRCGPFPGNIPHPDHSGLFLYLNRNKRGITLNIRTATGREILSRLLKEADILIEDTPPKLAENLELDYAHLREINPRLIVASITPFGQTGPYRDYKAYAINESGIGGMSPIIGEPNREPLTPPFSLGHFQTGIITANAIMFALRAQNRLGKGQHIDVSEAESWAIFHTGNVVSSFVYSGRKRKRTGYRTLAPYPYTILPCKDGYVSMIALRGSEWKRFLEIVGEGSVPEWYTSDERFQDRLRAGLEYADVLDSLLAPWLMSHTREEIFALCRENHIPFTPVRTMDEVVNCEHLNQRKYFAMVECSGKGTFKCPGPPVRFSRSSWIFKQMAFLLGEDNYEVYCKRLGYSREELAQLRRAKIV
ncbi:Succinyl-CoA--L-malate CoA-transferase alpha subunit [subsurface metagenome]|jgi:crotonobetainyl-CoA:carnitine CoA-transferase CaiB-like acyl-CoA transferase